MELLYILKITHKINTFSSKFSLYKPAVEAIYWNAMWSRGNVILEQK